MIGVDQLTEVSEFGWRELAGFDEVGGEAAGGTIEDVVDEFADHRFGRGGLCDGGRPLLATGGMFAADQAFIKHHTEHRGDRGRSHVALATECFTNDSERRGTAVPQDAEDFEFYVSGDGAGWAGNRDGWEFEVGNVKCR